MLPRYLILIAGMICLIFAVVAAAFLGKKLKEEDLTWIHLAPIAMMLILIAGLGIAGLTAVCVSQPGIECTRQ